MAGLSDRDDEPRSNEHYIAEARSAVQLPATLLILVGVLGIIVAIFGIIQLNSLPAKTDELIANIEADPNMPREDKDNWIDVLSWVKDSTEQPTAIIGYLVNLVCSFLVLIGGIRMMQLSGPALPSIASILAMIPCTIGCCCMLGLPAGIISLVALNRPAVRAAMSRKDEG